MIVFDKSFLVEHRANYNGEIIGFVDASDPTRVTDALDVITALREHGEPLLVKGPKSEPAR